MRPRVSPFTANQDDLRRENIDKIAYRATQDRSGALIDRERLRVPILRERPQLLDAIVLAKNADRAPLLNKCRISDKRLKAALLATTAARATFDRCRVAKFSGSSAVTVIDVAVRDDAEADAPSERDGDEVLGLTPASIQALRDRERIDIVVDEDRKLQCLLQVIA